MSWPVWPAAGVAPPTVVQAPIINSAPNVNNPTQYTPEQWAQMQQQNWQQWAQWQQQFQQWQQQYGAEYQKSMTAMAQARGTAAQQAVPYYNLAGPAQPPLPTESKPPLPPEDPQGNNAQQQYVPQPPIPNSTAASSVYSPAQYSQPPPLIPPKNQSTYDNKDKQIFGKDPNWQNQGNRSQGQQGDYGGKRPYNQQCNEGVNSKRNRFENQQDGNNWQGGNQRQQRWAEPGPNRNELGGNQRNQRWGEPQGFGDSQNQQNQNWATNNKQDVKPLIKLNPDEPSEAEKKFDKQFGEWEAQFQKWKEQNANHPDKSQYHEYEKKWVTWRAQLLERREQMRRKRLGIGGDAPKTIATPDLPKVDHPLVQSIPKDLPSKEVPSDCKPETKQSSPISKGVGLTDTLPKLSESETKKELVEEDLSTATSQEDNSAGFLNTASADGIPGLDLVKDDEDTAGNLSENKPDLEAISRGINSILGDQNLMNMLSLVSQSQPNKATINLQNSSQPVGNSPKFSPNESFDPENEYSNQANLDEQSRSSLSITNDPENFNRLNEGENASFDCHNFNTYPQSQEFNRGFNRSAFNNGLNNNFNRGPNQFNNRFGDNLNQGRSFNQGENFNQGTNNFNQKPHFLNRGPNQNAENFNWGSNNLNRQPEKGKAPPSLLDLDFSKTHGNFNKEPPNFGKAPDNFNKSSEFDKDWESDNSRSEESKKDNESGNFRGGMNIRSSGNFNRGPDNFNRGPDNLDKGPDNFNKGPNNFNRGPSNFNRGSDNFNRGPDNFSRGPENFNRGGPDNFNRGGGDNTKRGFDNENRNNFFEGRHRDNENNFQRGSDNFAGGGTDKFNRNFDNFNRRGCNDFNRGRDNLNRSENNFIRGSDKFGNPENFNMHDFDRGPGKFEQIVNLDSNNINNVNVEFKAFQPNTELPNLNVDTAAPDENEGIWKSSSVIDYDHKSLKPSEPDVLLVPINMFDYRHKLLSRIPFPLRPTWLSDLVRNFPEFDPPVARQFDTSWKYDERERFNSWDRKPFDNRDRKSFEDKGRKLFENRDRRPFDDRERKPYDDKDRRPFDDYNRKSFDDRDRKPYNDRDKKPYDDRDRKSFGDRDRKPLGERDRNPFNERDRKPFDDRNRKPFDTRDRKSFDDRDRKSTDDRDRKNIDDRDHDKKFEDRKRTDDRDRNSYRNRDLKNEEPIEPAFQKPTDPNFDNNSFGESGAVFKIKESMEQKSLNKPAVPGKLNVTPIDDLLCAPGRFTRPPRIVIILRGPPGSGKSYLAKLIKDKEVENGGSAPRIICLDDYFMVEQDKEIDEDGKKVKVREMVYEYEECMEASYRQSLMKSFKKTITDGYFSFVIVDNVNEKVKYFGEMWSFAKQNGFQVYICEMGLDVIACTKRNIHGRSEIEIERCVAGWEPTPAHHPIVDASNLLLGDTNIMEVEMEEVNSPASVEADSEEHISSKWDAFDYSLDNLAKLDGTSKPLRPSKTMEDYLQLDEWTEPVAVKPGQKRVRWADLEEHKKQEKMRAIGFVVGQTNWDRMMDPTKGSSALTQTKYIERYK